MGERNFLTAFIVAGAFAAGFALWALQLLKDKNAVGAELLKARNDITQNSEQHDLQITELEAKLTELDQQIISVDDAWQKKVDELKVRQSERLASAYSQFNDLLGEGNKALVYINDLENRLRQGQEVTDAELEKLGAIASALGVLQSQYQKPMAEFTALGNYFAEKAAAQPDAPDARLGFLKRIFSRNYRDQQRSYREDLVKQSAYREAYTQFSRAYGRAQTQIDAMGSDLNRQAQKLYDLIDQKKANFKDLEDFFTSSKRTLNIHQQMLDFEPTLPDPEPDPPTTPEP